MALPRITHNPNMTPPSPNSKKSAFFARLREVATEKPYVSFDRLKQVAAGKQIENIDTRGHPRRPLHGERAPGHHGQGRVSGNGDEPVQQQPGGCGPLAEVAERPQAFRRRNFE